jgi:hypothetical protein
LECVRAAPLLDIRNLRSGVLESGAARAHSKVLRAGCKSLVGPDACAILLDEQDLFGQVPACWHR